MRRRAQLLAQARVDLDGILRWIAGEAQNVQVGLDFAARLRQRCDDIASLPGALGRARDDLGPGLRSLAWRGYVILFRYAGGKVQVVRLLHGARDQLALTKPDDES